MRTEAEERMLSVIRDGALEMQEDGLSAGKAMMFLIAQLDAAEARLDKAEKVSVAAEAYVADNFPSCCSLGCDEFGTFGVPIESDSDFDRRFCAAHEPTGGALTEDAPLVMAIEAWRQP